MLRTDLSTSTPASNISRADFERMEARDDMANNSDESADALMADILRNSPARALLGLKDDEESLPESETDETPEESDEDTKEVPETSEDAVDDSDEDKDQEASEEETDEDDSQESTQNADLPTEEDIDWEYKVPVKIDGKVVHVSLEEIRKGYATDQHLSQKGRELGELKKQIEEERNTKLNELVQLGTILHEELTSAEAAFVTQYNEIKGKITKAKEDGDSYTARELKEELEGVQEKYWDVRRKREERTKAIVEKIQGKQAEEQQQLLQNFQEQIQQELPEFDEKLAKSIRDFALKEGLPEELLNQIYDARVVRVLNDYRKLKLAKETGVVKRKSVPTAKATPAKKGPSKETKDQREQKSLRDKVLQGGASKADETNFLKSISSLRHKL
jgi:F0F1-type ATP synthase membrane subunit b/b'